MCVVACKVVNDVSWQPVGPMSSSWNASPLQMGPTGCPETSLINLQPTPHNIPEEQRPQMDRCGRVESPEDHFLCSVWNWVISCLLISYVRLSGFKYRLSDLNTSTSTYLVLKGFKNRSHTENFNPKLEPSSVESRITHNNLK